VAGLEQVARNHKTQSLLPYHQVEVTMETFVSSTNLDPTKIWGGAAWSRCERAVDEPRAGAVSKP
jgi:hypothetical protein